MQTTVIIMIIVLQDVEKNQENVSNSRAHHLMYGWAPLQINFRMEMKLVLDEYCLNYKTLLQQRSAFIRSAQLPP